MERIPSREEILEASRERANSRASNKSFDDMEEEEAHYLRMHVLYMTSAKDFMTTLPQMQSLILKEDLENLSMTARMEILESIVDSCGSSYNISKIVEGLSNRLPMPFREKPMVNKEINLQMHEREIFEQAIISCWYIYPGYSPGLHSVVEYLAEKMEAKYLLEFSPACIQVLEEVGSRKDSTAKAARTILDKIQDPFGENEEVAKENYEEEEDSYSCDSHGCGEFFQYVIDVFRGFLKIEYSEERNDKVTMVQVQVEPDIF